jgi:hypothetical protein
VEPNDAFFGGIPPEDDKNPVLYTVEPVGPGFEPLLKMNLPGVTINQQSPMFWLAILGFLILMVSWSDS